MRVKLMIGSLLIAIIAGTTACSSSAPDAHKAARNAKCGILESPFAPKSVVARARHASSDPIGCFVAASSRCTSATLEYPPSNTDFPRATLTVTPTTRGCKIAVHWTGGLTLGDSRAQCVAAAEREGDLVLTGCEERGALGTSRPREIRLQGPNSSFKPQEWGSSTVRGG